MIKHIVVTQEHIDKGIPEEPQMCPVYLAINEVCKDVLGVHGPTIEFINRGEDNPFITIPAPEVVEQFVGEFDEDSEFRVFKPFEFDLDIPDNVKCD